MEERWEHSIALLEHTPGTLDALLRRLPASLIQGREGEGTWCAFDVVAHLVDCEVVNFMPRARMILGPERGEAFPPFARDGYLSRGEGRPLAELLDAFADLRAKNLAEVKGWNLQASDLALEGRHPAFGAVTLSQLLATWAAHDLTHLHQLSRLLAYSFREAVGPWVEYLGVLHCNGHGG